MGGVKKKGSGNYPAREEIVRSLLEHVVQAGPLREGLRETPRRVVAAWEHWTQGCSQNPQDILKTFSDGAEGCGDEIVLVANCPIWSTCEHHLAPFWGLAHIGYLPRKRIVGLSKFPRLVDVFARRLQVQERMTNQIADSIMDCLDPKGAGVILECRHSCMESRGVGIQGAITTTSSLRGLIKEDPLLRNEFFQLILNTSKAKNGL